MAEELAALEGLVAQVQSAQDVERELLEQVRERVLSFVSRARASSHANRPTPVCPLERANTSHQH
jgi:hypothetical protein